MYQPIICRCVPVMSLEMGQLTVSLCVACNSLPGMYFPCEQFYNSLILSLDFTKNCCAKQTMHFLFCGSCFVLCDVHVTASM